MKLTPVIQLGAHVETDLGEGFVVGRSSVTDPNYDVRLFDRTRCCSYKERRFATITLINNYPVDHPKLPTGMRDYIRQKMPMSA